MSNSNPVCSIIIRSYNEEKHLERLLEGILQQTVKDVEIILVDSGSTDNTIEIASRYPVRVLQIPPQEFTFGRSLNLGIQHAQSEFLVFASAHVYPVYPDWLEKLLEPFSDPQVALVYGKQTGAETSQYSEHQIFSHWYPNISQARQITPFCNNANAGVRRSLALARPYNELLPGLEDLEWAQWAMNQGYFISYVAEAEIVHIHNETPKGVYNRYRREAMAFKQIYSHEQFSIFDFLRLATTNIMSDLRHAITHKKFSNSWAGIIWFRTMQFWGTYQGYRNSGPLTWQLRQTFYYPRALSHPHSENNREVNPIRYQNRSE